MRLPKTVQARRSDKPRQPRSRSHSKGSKGPSKSRREEVKTPKTPGYKSGSHHRSNSDPYPAYKNKSSDGYGYSGSKTSASFGKTIVDEEETTDYENWTDLAVNAGAAVTLLLILAGFSLYARLAYDYKSDQRNTQDIIPETTHGALVLMTDIHVCTVLAGRMLYEKDCHRAMLAQVVACIKTRYNKEAGFEMNSLSGTFVAHGFAPDLSFWLPGKTRTIVTHSGSLSHLLYSPDPNKIFGKTTEEALEVSLASLRRNPAQMMEKRKEGNKAVDVSGNIIERIRRLQGTNTTGAPLIEHKASNPFMTRRWGRLEIVTSCDQTLGPLASAIIQTTLKAIDRQTNQEISNVDLDKLIVNHTISALRVYANLGFHSRQWGDGMVKRIVEEVDKQGVSGEAHGLNFRMLLGSGRTYSILSMDRRGGLLKTVALMISGSNGTNVFKNSASTRESLPIMNSGSNGSNGFVNTDSTRLSLPFINAAPILILKDSEPYLALSSSGKSRVLDNVVSGAIHAIYNDAHPVKILNRQRDYFDPVKMEVAKSKRPSVFGSLQAVRFATVDGTSIMFSSIDPISRRWNVPVGL